MKYLRAEILMLFATLLAALGWLGSKHVITSMSPAMFISSRFLVASLILAPLCWREITTYSRHQSIRLLSLGVILGTGLLLCITAVQLGDAIGEGAFIMTLSMLFAPLLHWGLFRLVPPPTFWLAFPLALCGLALLSLAEGFSPAPSQLYYVLAAIMISLHFTLNQRYSTKGAEQSTPLGRLCIQLFAVSLTAGVLCLLTEFQQLSLSQITAESWLWFIISVVLATSLRFWCQLSAQSLLAPSTAALMMLLEPIWTMGLSMARLNETLTANKLAGCCLILLALLVQSFMPEQWVKLNALSKQS